MIKVIKFCKTMRMFTMGAGGVGVIAFVVTEFNPFLAVWFGLNIVAFAVSFVPVKEAVE